MSYPLWSNTNQTMFSSIFNVPQGKVCVLFASKLERDKYRVDNTEFLSPQSVCVRRIVHDFEQVKFIRRADCSCDWIFDVDAYSAHVVADEIIDTGCCWTLTRDKNLGIIGVPGTYRLELNDSTAIGTAQVYADLYNAENFPTQAGNLFFQ